MKKRSNKQRRAEIMAKRQQRAQSWQEQLAQASTQHEKRLIAERAARQGEGVVLADVPLLATHNNSYDLPSLGPVHATEGVTLQSKRVVCKAPSASKADALRALATRQTALLGCNPSGSHARGRHWALHGLPVSTYGLRRAPTLATSGMAS